MAKKKTNSYICSVCDATFPTWMGQCSNCESWNMIVEVSDDFLDTSKTDFSQPIEEVVAGFDSPPVAISDTEVSRAIDGGIVAGSTLLIGGEPGIGKSTLALLLAKDTVESGGRVLYVTGEESKDQVAARVLRCGLETDGLEVIATSSIEKVVSTKAKYDLLIVDSIQAMADGSIDSPPGSINQVRQCSSLLSTFARRSKTPVVILSHVTKDGSIAGPKQLEHLVDAVYVIEGERSGTSRSLRSLKNRFGRVSEVGYLKMTPSGLTADHDFVVSALMDRRVGAYGSAVTAVRDGLRVRLVEIQTLVVPTGKESPRRIFNGIASVRGGMIIGVLDHYIKLRSERFDIFVSVAGGISIDDPASDLAVAAAITSAITKHPIPKEVGLFGEVGLTGEVRRVSLAYERYSELLRHGFSTVVGPKPGNLEAEADRGLINVRTVSEALLAGHLIMSNDDLV
ncbi:MAG: AAA family ATPase [Actinomycetota bacterium]|nr:AAA family ATPase [Actinomycetota bacterium]